MYIVFQTRDGSNIHEGERQFFSDIDAVGYAASLCGVTRRTIRTRIAKWSHPSGCWQVAGRETNGGVWIEFA
jgi:hypothetical protein